MSERGAFRGRGGGGGRGDHRGGRGGGRGGAHGGNAAGQQQTERPKKENILDLSKYMDKQITVKFSGGREGESIGAGGGVERRQQIQTQCADWREQMLTSLQSSAR
jgi:hypothetical protein